MTRSRHHSGETLVEAIIAIAILVLIIAPASALNISALRSIVINRTDLIASSLAEEGIEMMRAVRDTNLLRFSSKVDECWNTYPFDFTTGNAITLDLCDQAANLIEGGYFRIRRVINSASPNFFQWILEPNGASEAASIGLSQNLNLGSDAFFRLRLDETTGVHSHFVDDTHTYIHQEPLLPTRGTPTNFYREIFLEYEPFDGEQVLRVVSRVRYLSGQGVSTVSRVAILSPYPPNE